MSIAVFEASIQEIWNDHDRSAIARFISPRYFGVDPAEPEPIVGVDGYEQHFLRLTTGFPDVRITIDDIFGRDDLVAARWTVDATHSGPFGDIPPTGRRISVTGIAMVRITSRQIVLEHANSDTLGLLTQLGIIPRSPGAPIHLLF